MSLRDAFFHSPGPRGMQENLKLFLKGLCMGAADIVPGVSGGTVALISGIYEDLLNAIKSFDVKVLWLLLQLKFSQALERTHLRFLLVLLSGILLAMVSLARVIYYMMENHPVEIWSLFFGMILASIVYLMRKLDAWHGTNLILMIIGTVLAYLIVGMIPVTTPETYWFIFLSGVIAICAMILPGISGSFLLLIMGKYQFITGALMNPWEPGNLLVLLVFVMGAAVGIAGFSRFLTWLLNRYHMATLAFLAGLMAGSIRKVWPWKEVLETTLIRGKLHVLREANVMPQVDIQLVTAIGLMCVGYIAVNYLEQLSPEN